MLETSDMCQHRDIHIDDTWLQQIHISNSENRIYLHSAHGKENSKNETNMQQTEADVDNSDDSYSEVNNKETSTANRDTMLDNTATDMQSSTYILALGEGKNPVFNKPLAEYLSFSTIFCGKVRPSKNE